MDKKSIEWIKLQKYLRRVSEHLPLTKAILFGSRARGEEIEESDYDLLLVSPFFSGMSFPDRISFLLDLWEADEELEVFPYTPEEFEEKRNEICVVSEAARDGINLLEDW